eukprot:7921279-Pyramimonas_sp.AAC.1
MKKRCSCMGPSVILGTTRRVRHVKVVSPSCGWPRTFFRALFERGPAVSARPRPRRTLGAAAARGGPAATARRFLQGGLLRPRRDGAEEARRGPGGAHQATCEYRSAVPGEPLH